MNWLSAITALISAAWEGIKAAFVYDAGKTKEILKQMEKADDEVSRANAARNADSVPDDADPFNRSNK